MQIRDDRNVLLSRKYELGSLFLVLLNVYLSFAAGRLLGFRGAELSGYSMGSILLVLIVLGTARLLRRARTTSAMARIAFFTLLIILLGTLSSLMQARAKLSRISTEIDPESQIVDEEQAKALASQIEDSVSRRGGKNLVVLYDSDRFMKKVLRGRDTASTYFRDIARGGSQSFTKGTLPEQMASMVTQGAEFRFVKLYRKDNETILQFRLTEPAGNLHYLDFYIFKTSDGKIRIDDLHYHNSGPPLSNQIIDSAESLNVGGPSCVESIQKSVQLAQEGNVREGLTILESLPDDVRQQKMIMRLRIQWGYQVDVAQAVELLDRFKEKFPDDSGVVFSAFAAAIAKSDLGSAVNLIDDIYKAVHGDEYLLWYEVKLFLAQKHYQKAAALLSEMENKYNIDVASLAESNLPQDFRSSKEYDGWLRKHRKQIEKH